jgi:hypothetical protein
VSAAVHGTSSLWLPQMTRIRYLSTDANSIASNQPRWHTHQIRDLLASTLIEYVISASPPNKIANNYCGCGPFLQKIKFVLID